MSSEPATDAPRSGQRRFRITAAVTIAALVLATVGLTVANAVQGPRLVSADVNPRMAVERVGQRLVLRLDQAIAEVSVTDIAVTPAVPVALSLERATLIVRFEEVLRHATRYEVVIPVRSTTTDRASKLSYGFRTPDPEVYVLQRAGSDANSGPEDQIVRTVVGAGTRDIVQSAQGIQEYAVAEPSIAVITADDAKAGRLTVGPVDGSEPARTLVDNADIGQLQSSGRAGMFGFVARPLSGPDQDLVQLQIYDPTAGGDLIKVVGFDGKPLAPQVWAFVPGTTSIVVQTEDASFFLIDPINGTPARPLGSHVMMHGFVYGTATMIVQDPGGYTAIDLVTGSASPLPVFDQGTTAAVYRLFDLPGDRGLVALVASLAGGNLRYSTVTLTSTRVRPLFAPEPPSTLIQQVCLSPNGEYLAVETIPADAVPDNYPFVLGYPKATTVLVEVATGRSDRAVPGFAVHWCD
jgi:hypothetical protein